LFNENEVLKFLQPRWHSIITRVRIRESDEAIILYVPRSNIAATVKKGFTSSKQLENLKKGLSDAFSTEAEFVFTQSESHNELEAGFFQLLRRSSNGAVKSLFISFSNEDLVDTWIEVDVFSESEKKNLDAFYGEILKNTNLEKGNIFWIDIESEKPSVPAILRTIKVLQPVKIDVLCSELLNIYPGVNERWLKSKLDLLRKKYFVHWQRPGTYVLTSAALSAVPTSTNRTSSDVKRALALGRKKW
jgi:hypothetical protein